MPSIYLNRREQLMLDRLAGVNGLAPNTVLRLALVQLHALADAAGRLPLAGQAAPSDPVSPVDGNSLASRLADQLLEEGRQREP